LEFVEESLKDDLEVVCVGLNAGGDEEHASVRVQHILDNSFTPSDNVEIKWYDTAVAYLKSTEEIRDRSNYLQGTGWWLKFTMYKDVACRRALAPEDARRLFVDDTSKLPPPGPLVVGDGQRLQLQT
jgi:hypothetical protein